MTLNTFSNEMSAFTIRLYSNEYKYTHVCSFCYYFLFNSLNGIALSALSFLTLRISKIEVISFIAVNTICVNMKKSVNMYLKI